MTREDRKLFRAIGQATREEAVAAARAVLDQVTKDVNMEDLAGEGPGRVRYDAFIGGLKQVIREAAFLRGHEHAWGPDDYCWHCGADGRA